MNQRDNAIKDLKNQKKFLQEDLSKKNETVTKREIAVKNVSRELVKANDVIIKLNNENQKMNFKMKIGCQIIQEQEKILDEKDFKLEHTRKQFVDKIDEITKVLDNKNDMLDNVRKQIQDQLNSMDMKNNDMIGKQNMFLKLVFLWTIFVLVVSSIILQ